jgi:hypothetical protein
MILWYVSWQKEEFDMDFLEKTYVDNGITYYIDVEALSAELDIRRGKEGVQNLLILCHKKTK